MQYKANDPTAYLSELEDDWRKERLLNVREILFRQDPRPEEGMEYKMLAYRIGDKNIFHLNAQRNYVSLYVGDVSKVENSASYLEPFSVGKGCIRIKKSIHLEDTRLEEFISEVIRIHAEGGDTDC